MNVLIVEDEPSKAKKIEEILGRITSLQQGCNIKHVETLSSAAKMVGSNLYELIILDLMLPYIPSGKPSSSAGLELLRLIRNEGGKNHASLVVGLSAYPDEIESTRGKFEAAGVLIIEYSPDSYWQDSLTHIVNDVIARSSRRSRVDFLAICALEEEREGFHTCVNEISRAVIKGVNVSIVELKQDSTKKGVIVRLSRMGLVAATLETAIALSIYETDIVFMSGICAGVSRNSKLGELLIASPAWEYQAGKWSKEKFEISPQQVDIDPATRSKIDHIIGSADLVRNAEAKLQRSINRPKQPVGIKISPFASGSAVIADASRIDHIQQQHRKIAGFDMEVFGMYYSAHHSQPRPLHVFAIKCVVDLADAKKNDDLHEYGCAVSAHCGSIIALNLLEGAS